jgi:hypothetical protein
MAAPSGGRTCGYELIPRTSDLFSNHNRITGDFLLNIKYLCNSHPDNFQPRINGPLSISRDEKVKDIKIMRCQGQSRENE